MTSKAELPTGWEWSTVQEVQATQPRSLVSGPFGSSIGRRFFVDSGVPVIRGNNLTRDMTRFVDEGFVFLTKEKAAEFPNCKAEPGDLVFTAAGTLGQVGLIPDSSKYDYYIISNKQLRARLDRAVVEPLFAFYWFSSPAMVSYVERRNTGSTVPLINLSVLRSLPLPLPPLEEQRAIVSVLGALDDKIALNRNLSLRLDEALSAVFREWFVIGREYSCTLGDWLAVGLGGVWGSADSDAKSTVPYLCLRGVDVAALDQRVLATPPTRWASEKQVRNRRLAPGAVVVEASGECGRSVTWLDEYDSLFDRTVLYSNFCKRLDPRCSLSQAVVAGQWLRHAKKTGGTDPFVTGTAMPNLDVNALLSNLATPSFGEEESESYLELHRAFLRLDLLRQSETLGRLRDALLPRLFSGQIRVADAEKVLEEVM